MERMFRVQTVTVAGPGFNSMSQERRRKARTEGLRKRKERWRAKSRKMADGVCVSWECCQSGSRDKKVTRVHVAMGHRMISNSKAGVTGIPLKSAIRLGLWVRIPVPQNPNNAMYGKLATSVNALFSQTLLAVR